jgi:hypothetical protein
VLLRPECSTCEIVRMTGVENEEFSRKLAHSARGAATNGQPTGPSHCASRQKRKPALKCMKGKRAKTAPIPTGLTIYWMTQYPHFTSSHWSLQLEGGVWRIVGVCRSAKIPPKTCDHADEQINHPKQFVVTQKHDAE